MIKAVFDLSGAQLDYQVALALKLSPFMHNGEFFTKASGGAVFYPSAHWEQAGPIITQEKIDISFNGRDGLWYSHHFDDSHKGITQWGPDPLTAAMRCFVELKLGSHVEVPDE